MGLAPALLVIAGFFGVELTDGLLSGSLTLLSDAGHMVADGVALGATRVVTRADTSGRRTYGYYRAEVFASGLAVPLMLAPPDMSSSRRSAASGNRSADTGPVLVVGALGLVVNLVAMALLRGGAVESLNVKGAYLEVVADTAGSVGVLLAGWLVWGTTRATGTQHRRHPARHLRRQDR